MNLKEIKQQLNIKKESVCFKLKMCDKEYVQTVKVLGGKVDFFYYELIGNKIKEVTDENILALLIDNCEMKASKRVYAKVFADDYDDLCPALPKNSEVKKWGQQYIRNILMGCRPFVRVYGSKKINKRMAELNAIYTDVEDDAILGFQEYNNIALCFKGKDGQMCTPQDLQENEKMRKTLLHEGVHFALRRDEYSTGILNTVNRNCEGTVFYTGKNRLIRRLKKLYQYEELGRGLNEGYTEWIVKKCGFGINNSGYKELETFVEELELALGEKTVMKLGKGKRIHRLLKMSKQETYAFLAKADRIYENIRKTSELSVAKSESEKILLEHDQTKMKYLRKWQMSREYAEYLINKKRKDSMETFREFCESTISELDNQSRDIIADFQDEVYERYFRRDLQRTVMNLNTAPSQKIKRYQKLYKLMSSNEEERGVAIKELKEFQSEVTKKATYDIEKRIKNGKLTVKDIFEYCRKTKNSEDTFQSLLTLGGKIFNTNYEGYYFAKIAKKLINDENLSDITNYSIIRLAGDSNYETLFEKKGRFYDKTTFKNAVEIESSCINPKKIINFELREGEDEKTIIKEFSSFKSIILAQNLGARIKVAGRVIIVEKRNGQKDFYSFNQGIKSMSVSKVDRLGDFIKDGLLFKMQSKNPYTSMGYPGIFRWLDFQGLQIRTKRRMKKQYGIIPQKTANIIEEEETSPVARVKEQQDEFLESLRKPKKKSHTNGQFTSKRSESLHINGERE